MVDLQRKSEFGPKSQKVSNFEWIDLESEECDRLLVFCIIKSDHKSVRKKLSGTVERSGKCRFMEGSFFVTDFAGFGDAPTWAGWITMYNWHQQAASA